MFAIGFNTQPPEGGCDNGARAQKPTIGFNTQPPEGGCLLVEFLYIKFLVSTHSRPKAAA